MKNSNKFIFIIAITILTLTTSCSQYIQISKFESGQYFEDVNDYRCVNNPWLKFYLEEKIGYQDVHLKQSTGLACNNVDKTFTITDIEGIDHKITQDEYGLDITLMKITHIVEGKIKQEKVMVITKASRLDFHIATKINGNIVG